MREYTITIDTGTTNTRVALWDKNQNLKAVSKAEIGVRNTAFDGSNQRLKIVLRECMDQVLEECGLTFEDIKRVLASGMITSNMGLLEIPHATAPVGAKELAAQAKEVLMEEVCPIPILFVPGVKNPVEDVTIDTFDRMDMMRGEEVEAIAMMQEYPAGKPYLFVLPGSHTKFVAIDEKGRITGCLTTITGELLSAITNHTLIADAVGRQFVEETQYEKEMVLRGYHAAKRDGIGRASFAARILNTFAEKDKMKIANYILGAVLQNDIEAVIGSKALNVSKDTILVVSGKNPLRRALYDLFLEEGCFGRVEEYEVKKGTLLSAQGVWIVADNI